MVLISGLDTQIMTIIVTKNNEIKHILHLPGLSGEDHRRKNIPGQVIWFLAAAGITGDTLSPDISLSYKVTIQTLTGSKDVKEWRTNQAKCIT